MFHKWLGALYSGDYGQLDQAPEFYEELLKKIEASETQAQVSSLIKGQGLLEKFPGFFIEAVKAGYERTVALNLLFKNQTDRLLEKLEGRGLEAIPLKGVYFAETYFGYFGARSTSDIDLLIHDNDFEKIRECLQDQGFTVQEPSINKHFHSSFSKPGPGSIPLTVELHWNLIKEDSSSFNVEKVWNRAKPFKNFKAIKALSDHDVFYFMILHAWRHNLDSTRHFLDLVQLIHVLNDQIDYSPLLEEAKRDLTYRRVLRTLSLLYQEFPHLEAIVPFPFKIHKGFWKGRGALDGDRSSLNTYMDFVDYQLLSYDKPHHGIRELYKWVVEEKINKRSVRRGD